MMLGDNQRTRPSNLKSIQKGHRDSFSIDTSQHQNAYLTPLNHENLMSERTTTGIDYLTHRKHIVRRRDNENAKSLFDLNIEKVKEVSSNGKYRIVSLNICFNSKSLLRK